jgi:hypothetical protein|tara:strand:+ start:230 stop:424 length:195 start_codon:yes stop_codon:yes gene_type:complete
MNKKQVLDKIKKETGCDQEVAERIFQKAIREGMVKPMPNWNFLVTFVIYLTALITGVWALWQHL